MLVKSNIDSNTRKIKHRLNIRIFVLDYDNPIKSKSK